jgi:ribosomal protein S18 acetylase RimI-like enzyme
VAVTVRRAIQDDALSIARVHVDTWRSAYRGIIPESYLNGLSYDRGEGRWLERLRNPAEKEAIFVATSAEGVIGFCSCGPERTGDPVFKGEVYAIYVLPTSQRQGAGRALMLAAWSHLKEVGLHSVTLWVLRDNPSRGFYERLSGKWLREKEVKIGGEKLVEVAYGWKDVGPLTEALQSS